ncbi:Os10g0333000 [Oryza sativa Japonica Group]|uniref:Os10g0333000 protein n=1 Tax=Oryza sativa subsp. japonica TaxID=39947 RepID=A0A0P0XTG2_ORYSJ|nr:Os10g0333000 [Oryza sativa Japonica Group]
MPDLGGDGDEAEKAPTLSPAAVACARGRMQRRRRTAAMASDGLGGAVPRSNPVTTVVLCPDPVAAGVPRLTSHGSTGGGGEESSGRQATLQSSPPLPPPASSCALPSSWLSSTSSLLGRCRLPMDVDSDPAAKGKPTQIDLEDQVRRSRSTRPHGNSSFSFLL